jgi:hypothetical protein
MEEEKFGIWINVKDKLPDHPGRYLITEEAVDKQRYNFVSYFEQDGYWYDDYVRSCEPLAWMLLPDPYSL